MQSRSHRLSMRGVLALVLAIASIAVLMVAPVAAQDNVLRVVSNFDIRTADPHVAYEVETWTTVGLFYKGLVELETPEQVVPALAESYTVSDDGLVYTFVLREGVTFSNGRAITADDVKYSFERLLNPNLPHPTAFFFESIAGVPEYRDGSATEVSGIRVVDERTVEFTLQYPVWSLIQRFALPPGVIVAREGVEAAGEEFGRMPLGAGPFVLDSWQPGVIITANRNPTYYKEGLPNFDRIEIELMVEPSVGILRIEAGEADIAFDWVPNSDYPRIAADPNLADQLVPSLAFPNIDYIVFNVRNEPLSNPQVRQALSMAIDRERLTQILNGRATPASGPIPPVVPGNNADLQPYTYDPEGARTMLAEAGYPDGFTTEVLTNTDPTSISVAQAFVADWAQIGVNATITSIDNAQFLDILVNQPETTQVIMTSWYLDYLDPSNIFEPLIKCGGSYNWGGFCSEALDATFEEINLLPPDETRWAAFSDFEADIFAETPVAYLYHLNNYYFRADNLDIVADASTLLRFDRAARR